MANRRDQELPTEFETPMRCVRLLTSVVLQAEYPLEARASARRGQNYCLSDERAKTISTDYLKRSKKIIHDAARELA